MMTPTSLLVEAFSSSICPLTPAARDHWMEFCVAIFQTSPATGVTRRIGAGADADGVLDATGIFMVLLPLLAVELFVGTLSVPEMAAPEFCEVVDGVSDEL